MSYHFWPVTGYGLIYQGNEKLKDITKIFDKDSVKDFICIYKDDIDEDEDFSEYDLLDIGGNVIDPECDGKYSTSLDGKNELDDPWIWFSCRKCVSPLRQAYSSWQEMAQEFIDNYSDSLKLPPINEEDWWLKHLGYVEYVQGG